jgi:hypothetical protein
LTHHFITVNLSLVERRTVRRTTLKEKQVRTSDLNKRK